MSSTLFSDPPPTPAAIEPPVWIRRLVLLRAIEPEADVIREIPFELGLNLILTRQPLADSTEALGHDVGKTLLTRLTRYLLGETRYAETRTQAAIRHALPDSVVAGEFRVGGKDWAVMRPLGTPPSVFVDRAGQVNGWRELLGSEGTEGEYPEFLRHVSDAVLEPVTSPLLTHARRPIAWLDVLAWIARDQKCRYAHPLVWRHAATESGTPVLHTDDASTVLRCISGLMDPREKTLFEEHDVLLQRRQTLAEETKQLDRQLAAEEAVLTSDLQELLKSKDLGICELTLEVIRDKAKKLEDLRGDEIKKLGIAALRTDYEAAVAAMADAAALENALAEQSEAVSVQIRKREERPLSVYERFAALCDKPVDDCPAKLKIAKQQVPSPDMEDLAELKSEVDGYKKRRAEVAGKKQILNANLETHRSNLKQAEEQLPTVTAGIDGRIALHKTLDQRVERHIQRINRRPQAAKDLSELDAEIERSSEVQRQRRDALATMRAWLPMRFSALCKELVGGKRRFELAVESKAIRLNIAGTTGAPGEATATSALVLSLDLAAIQSAIEGHGHHPRLMIFDSPREADMEIGIFNRMIRRIAAWHQASPKPAFQIIMTTTTRPQETDAPSNVIRVELARVPAEDLLLRVEL